MKNFYPLIVLVLLLLADVAFGQTMIKRASLSTSVAGAHNIQFGNYKVQQSIGHMGITGSIKNQNRTVIRGFLLPQSTATTSTPTPTLDFNLSVYPNPFVDYVEFSFDTPVTGDMAVRLHDVTGQLIYDNIIEAKQEQRIQLSHLAQAEYILSVEVMGKFFSFALVNQIKTNRNL